MRAGRVEAREPPRYATFVAAAALLPKSAAKALVRVYGGVAISHRDHNRVGDAWFVHQTRPNSPLGTCLSMEKPKS